MINVNWDDILLIQINDNDNDKRGGNQPKQ